MKRVKLVICSIIGLFILGMEAVKAQEGNQILDGIGETGLIARYIFDGDAKDWSRNNLHGTVHGNKATFVPDATFKKVLSLSGDDRSYISIPGNAISGEESLSIAGWVFLNTDERDQVYFDFGRNGNNHFGMYPLGTKKNADYQAVILEGGKSGYAVSAPNKKPITNQWVHLAVVLDTPSKSMTIYIDGKEVGKTENVEVDLDHLFDVSFPEKNRFYVGRSFALNKGALNAKLHDFRIYRIPLTSGQIEIIRSNALKSNQSIAAKKKQEDILPQFDMDTPQLYNTYLTGVSNLEVTTEIGHLPRLPRYVEGTYANGVAGPKVRVLWPAPTDNTNVLQVSTYELVGQVPGTDFQPKAKITVREETVSKTPDQVLDAFQLNEVTLNMDMQGHTTKFIQNRDKFIHTLAQTNPDSFLYMFRNAFGQEQPAGAEPLGVWDSQETKLRGHATGHYLTAVAQAYASTGYDTALQEIFQKKMDYMVDVLHELSQMSGKPIAVGDPYVADPSAVPPGPDKTEYDSDLSENGIRTDYWNWGKGFISAYPPDQFIMLEHGATYGTKPNQIWAPYYTLHKILAGLMDVYEVTGNEKALEVAKGMGSWVYSRLSKLPTDTLISMWNTYIAGEFGGMNEAMSRLYRITGEDQYLKVAQLFDNIKMFFGDADHSHGLAKNVDTFRGLHANQHIPQIMGALEIYRDSGMPEYYHVADNFWFKAKNDYMYSIGGVAGARNPTNAECFVGQPATLYENGFASGGQNETCATYNMLKLTKNLFLFNQRSELMDYYERGLYNHILASVAEDSPANTYHVPLRPGSVKHFGNPNMTGFTCCNGTALESSTKLQNTIYFKSRDNQSLYVNLFIPSSLQWKERNISVEQQTSFPKSQSTRLMINGGGRFDLHVRVPNWATKGFLVTINGVEETIESTPGSYITLSRNWNDGDVVDVDMPFQFHLDPVMDQQNIASLFYGPILLAAQESEPRTDWRKITLEAEDLGKSIEGNPTELQFTIDGIVFKPFYETYGRHSVYLDVTLK